MTVLGAIIGGGQARRFGRDKAMALIEGRAMLDHVVATLTPQVDAIVTCGRDWPGLLRLEDVPQGGHGPLAGLNAALQYAQGRHDAVVAVPVDVVPLPDDLVQRLSGHGAAVFAVQHMIGYWPTALHDRLATYIADGGRSLNGWIAHVGARRVPDPDGLRNVNFPDDLPDHLPN